MPITEKQTVCVNSGFAHPADTTKQVQFDMSGITASSPAVVTVPDASGTMGLVGDWVTAGVGKNVLVDTGAGTTVDVSSIQNYPIGIYRFDGTSSKTVTNFTNANTGFVLVVINSGNSAANLTVDRSNSYLDGSANQTLGAADAIVLVKAGSGAWWQIGKLCANG